MKFAEGLVSSLLLSLPPSRLPVHPPLPFSPSPPPLCPARTLTSWSLYHPLQVPFQPPPSPPSPCSSSNHQLPRHYGIANLPDLLQVIFAQNRFNSNLGIRLFLLYVSGIPPSPLPRHITSTYHCVHVCVCTCLACARTWWGTSMWTWKVHEDVSSSKFVVESNTNYR